MTPLPISSIAAYSTTAAQTTSGSSLSSGNAPGKATNLASQDVFLQLLIAQLKNQDPSQPTDGTQFVTQLAQFTTLQEQTQGTSDLNKIVAALPSLMPTVPAPPAAPNGTTKISNQ